MNDDQTFSGDKAYQGEAQINSPHKKPKNGELNDLQKEENKLLSSQRIFVEHMIRAIKIFKVAQERFRLNYHKYAEVIMTICGEREIKNWCLKITSSKRGR